MVEGGGPPPLTVACSDAAGRHYDAAGRHYVAARAIKKGETVLLARPEAWAPPWPCPLEELTERELSVMRADAGPSPPTGEPSSSEQEDQAEVIGALSQNWLLTVRAALLADTDKFGGGEASAQFRSLIESQSDAQLQVTPAHRGGS